MAIQRRLVFLNLWCCFVSNILIQHVTTTVTTTVKIPQLPSPPLVISCQYRCGELETLEPCGCHAGCADFDFCCDDFQATCPDEYAVTSCSNRCGNKAYPDDLICFGGPRLCSCDQYCGFHGDCCSDFQQSCPEEFQDFRKTLELYPFNRTFHDFHCTSFPSQDEPSEENNYTTFQGSIYNLMITTCLDGSDCEFTTELNEDVNTFVPMYDIHRGVHYISGQCAMCNGARQVEPWDVTLNCEPLGEQRDYVNTGMVNSTESLADVKDTGACTISYRAPGESRICDPESGSSFLKMCPATFEDSWPTGSLSLTLVFDFDKRKGLKVGKHQPPECPIGEIFIPDEDDCRPVTCPSGFVLVGSDCIPEPSNITTFVTGMLGVEPTIKMIDTLNQNQNQLKNNIYKDVVEITDAFNITHNNLHVIPNFGIEIGIEIFKIQNVIQCNCDYISLFMANNSVHLERFKESILKEVMKDVTAYLMSRHMHLDSLQTDIIFDINTTSALNQKQINCMWLVYQKNETLFENDTVMVVSSGKTYKSGMKL